MGWGQILVPWRTSQRYPLYCTHTPWRRMGILLWLNYHHYFSYLTAFLVSVFLPSLISNYLCLLFGTLGMPRRLKLFSTNKKWGKWKGFCTQEDPAGSRSVSSSFLWYCSVLRGTRVGQERERSFLIERLIIISSEEFSFRETPFQEKAQTPDSWVSPNTKVAYSQFGFRHVLLILVW